MSSQQFVQAALTGELSMIVRGLLGLTLIIASTLLATIALSRDSAALRHRVWSLGIAAALLLPIAVALLPECRVGWIDPGQPVEVIAAAEIEQTTLEIADSQTTSETLPGAAFETAIDPAALSADDLYEADRRLRFDEENYIGDDFPTEPSAAELPAPVPSTGTEPDQFVSQQAVWLFVWLAGMTIGLARMGYALWVARRLVRGATPIDDESCLQLADQLTQRLALAGRPRLRASTATISPLCIGWRQPCVVLPAGWRNWPPEHLRSALAHELAHVARWDVAWQLLAQLACAVYWFHPLVWLAAWRMRVEREIACDDCVVRAGERPSQYAKLLLKLAEDLSPRATKPNRAAVAMATSSGVEQRIRAILSTDHCRTAVGSQTARALVLATIAGVLFLGALSPLAPGQADAEIETVAVDSAAQPVETDNQLAANESLNAFEEITPREKSDSKKQTQSKSTVIVSGRVVAESGDPLAGVDVRLHGYGAPPAVRSDAEGRFQLETSAKRQSRQTMIVASNGSGDLQGYHHIPYSSAKRQLLESIEVVLRPAREMVVSVRDADDRPVADAWVAFVSQFVKLADSTSDASGNVLLRVPAEAPRQYVLARKPQVGLDYVVFRGKGEPASDPYQLAPDHDEPLTLVLKGARTATVRIRDEQGNPLAGVTVSPEYFKKPKKGSVLYGSLIQEIQSRTDQNGLATIETIPVDNKGKVPIWAKLDGYFAPERFYFDPNDAKKDILAGLTPMVPVSGRVAFADGRPAAQIEVLARGAGYQDDHFRGSTYTDSAGRFEILVYPDQYYQFVASGDRWVSKAQTQVVRAGQPVKGLKFVLDKATRVYGRVTMGADRRPLRMKHLALSQQTPRKYRALAKAEQLPDPSKSRKNINPSLTRFTGTDDEGRFEFLVGPGEYSLSGPNNNQHLKFTITDQQEYEILLHAAGPDHGEISGRVVMQDDAARGVAEAKVIEVALDHSVNGFDAITDQRGRFAARRGLAELVVYARSEDGKLAGIVKSAADDTQVTIPIGPTATAHGRIVDIDSGKPKPGEQIDYSIHFKPPGVTYISQFGGSVTTDAQGEFTAEGLVPGWQYQFLLVVERDGGARSRSWTKVGLVTPDHAGLIELGDLKRQAPSRPLTIPERTAKAFRNDQSLEKRLREKIRDAGLAHQRLFLVLADPESIASRRFFTLYYNESNRRLWKSLHDYDLLTVNVAASDQAEQARTQLETLGVNWPDPEGLTMAVLDENGQLVAQTSDKKMTTGDKQYWEPFIAFFRAHRPQLPDAKQRLAQALTEAKGQNKRVFVQVSGANCGPCVLLSRYLADQKELFTQDYIFLKLDTRFKNGQAVIEELRKEAEGGIPWIVILDAEGKALITSEGLDGNIGYPEKSTEIAHFEKMLRSTSIRLSETDIQTLLKPLANKQ